MGSNAEWEDAWAAAYLIATLCTLPLTVVPDPDVVVLSRQQAEAIHLELLKARCQHLPATWGFRQADTAIRILEAAGLKRPRRSPHAAPVPSHAVDSPRPSSNGGTDDQP